ncbi:hypothetical protein E3P99_00954 [Wallemia hederae]|uniref:tRNA ligase n=1 Tax=Wallemia hederae TaxID=1540922 RepID=A0A4T0FSX5_9BASI|nr:hypothetical protein E3P99_00954 [Wallemia hederae]
MTASDATVLAQLQALSVQERPLVRQTEHSVSLRSDGSQEREHSDHNPNPTPTQLISWKMNEHSYAKSPSPFPTLARGLFSINDDIVVRGYDKFFNVDEVPWTTWAAITKYTCGPYLLSFKENGCIIFIAALSPTQLVVTSKHAVGPPTEQAREQGVTVTHSQMGEIWLERHLKSVGKSKEELAGVLHRNKWTAVAELCDDSFEEHVLGYPPHRSGLHLHGLNRNTAEFQTEEFETVERIAREYGFISTRHITHASLTDVQNYIKEVERNNGSVDGEPIEGFVVRCRTNDVLRDSPMPYPPHSPFFFKIKFDEPYLMFREWREITRGLLAKRTQGKLGSDESGTRKSTYPESVVYRDWVRTKMSEEWSLFESFEKGKGIIALRDRFLSELQSEELSSKLSNVRTSWNKKQGKSKPTKPQHDDRPFEKTMLVPIAVPGCGKTAVAMALSKLYGFAHTQSDDVRTKKTGPTFEKNVADLLKKIDGSDVVIADRNNHMKQHRERLNVLPFEQKPALGRVRMIALYWSIDAAPLNTVIRVCSERIRRRGTRHQSLRAGKGNDQTHEDIIVNFINQFQALDTLNEQFDAVIHLSLEDDLQTSTKKAIAGLREHGIDLKTITQDTFDQAMQAVLEYDPEYKRPDEDNSMKKRVEKGKNVGAGGAGGASSGPRYFAVGVECALAQLCTDAIGNANANADADADVNTGSRDTLHAFLQHLISHNRIANVPHITLLHQKELESVHESEYHECWTALANNSDAIDFTFGVDALMCNDRVMALSLCDVRVAEAEHVDDRVKNLVERVMSKKVLHITVGTRDSTVNPFESKAVVQKWKAGNSNTGIAACGVQGVQLGGRLRGMF